MIHNNKTLHLSTGSQPGLFPEYVAEVIDGCLCDFALEELENKPMNKMEKFKYLVSKLPLSARKEAIELVTKQPELKSDFSKFINCFKKNFFVPPMSCSQAIQEIGNLSQGELSVASYKEKFHLLTGKAGLDYVKCQDLFFEGLNSGL